MRIMVTGGLGFLGSHLCERLLTEEHDVLIVDNGSGASSLAHLRLLQRFPRCRWWDADICDICTDGPSWHARDAFVHTDVVIHLAAKAGVRASLDDPAGYVDTNIMGTLRVLEACRKEGVSKVIFASSSSVYGHPESPGTPSCESDACALPLSPYAMTKRAGELLCQTYAHLYGMQILCLRLFSVYGPRQRHDLVLPTFARHMLAGQPLQVFGDGTSVRDYTYIDDIVAGFIQALSWVDTPAKEGYAEIINLGSGTPLALYDMIEHLSRALGVPSYTVTHCPACRADADATHADIWAARALLGWEPTVSFPNGVQRFADWFLAMRHEEEGMPHGR